MFGSSKLKPSAALEEEEESTAESDVSGTDEETEKPAVRPRYFCFLSFRIGFLDRKQNKLDFVIHNFP